MPSWGELKQFARSKYKLKDDDDDGFSVVVEFENDRSQLIGVHHFSAVETAFIELRTYVCKENEMSPKVALKKNDDFVVGALALDAEGDYCLLHSAPLRSTGPAEFELILKIMARTADKLEAAYSGSDNH